MFGAIVLIIVLYLVTVPMLGRFKAKLPWIPIKLFQKLFWYHIFFALVYYLMTRDVRSDSVAYFFSSRQYTNWFDAFTTGTVFIHFVAYPFTNYLMFSYEMMMVLFSWFGYWGFVYFYIVFKESLQFKHKLRGYDLVTIFIFLPNMHYWTASLGKGAIIFLGIALVSYGLSRLSSRKMALLLGLVLVYYVRPHVFMFLAVGIIVGVITGREKVPFYQKFLVFTGSAVALFLLYGTIMSFVGLDQDNLIESFNEFSGTRSYELAKSAGSGIDISNYPLILKLLTFWFRPLFFDVPNMVGIVVSFENLLYIFLTLKLFDRKFLTFIKNAPGLVKTSGIAFLATSLALSGTLSNLGLIIRQKSMVMYFLLFVILSFMDYKKNIETAAKKRALNRMSQAKDIQLT